MLLWNRYTRNKIFPLQIFTSSEYLADMSPDRSRYLHNVPIAIFTSSDSISDRNRANKMGAADYIQKPCKKGDLLERIKGTLNRFKTRYTPDRHKMKPPCGLFDAMPRQQVPHIALLCAEPASLPRTKNPRKSIFILCRSGVYYFYVPNWLKNNDVS